MPNQFASALGFYQQQESATPGQDNPVALINRAIDQSDYTTAQQLLRDLRLDSVSNYNLIDGYYLEARCDYELGNYQAAAENIEAWLERVSNSITLDSKAKPGDTTLRRMYVDALLLQSKSYYQLAISSPPTQQRQLYRDSISSADKLLSSQDDSPAARMAAQVRLKSFMQLGLLSPQGKPAELKEVADRLVELAETERKAEQPSADSTKLQNESLYYAALCLNKISEYSSAQQLLEPLVEQCRQQEPTPQLLPFAINALAEAHLSSVIQGTASDSETADEHLASAQQLFAELEQSYPSFQKADVNFNLAVIAKLQGQWKAASDRYYQAAMDSSPDSNRRWTATLRETECYWELSDVETAEKLIQQVIDHLPLAQPGQQAEAIQMSLAIYEQAGNIPMLQQTLQQHGQILAANEQTKPQLDFYSAIAKTHSSDPTVAEEGTVSLKQLANSQTSVANRAKVKLVEAQFQQWNRIAANRPNLDASQQQSLQQDIEQFSKQCLQTLALPELDITKIPANPELLNDSQKQLLARRNQIQSWLAFSYLQAAQPAEALTVYSELLDQAYPSDQRVQWVAGKALALEQTAGQQAAIDLLKDELADSRNQGLQKSNLQLQLAQRLEDAQQFGGAALAYKQLYENAPNQEVKQQALLDTLYNFNQSKQFHQTIRLADQAAPYLAPAPLAVVNHSRGMAHYHLENFAAAIEDFRQTISAEKALQESNYNPQLLKQADTFLALSLMELKDPQTEQALRGLIDRYPGSEEAGMALTKLKDLGVQVSDAMVAKAQPATKTPADSGQRETSETSGKSTAEFESRLAQVPSLQAENKWDEIVVLLEDLTTNADINESGLGQAYYELGYAQRRLGDLQEATVNLETALSSQLTESLRDRTNYYLGDTYFSQRDFEKAENFFAKAEASASKDIQLKAAYMSAWTQQLQKNFLNAAEKFQTLANQFPDTALAQQSRVFKVRNLALAGQQQQAYDEFVALLPELSKNGWNSAEDEVSARLFAGETAIATQHFQQAKDWLGGIEPLLVNQSVKPSPEESSKILYQLAIAHLGLNETDQAMNIFTSLAKSSTTWGAHSLNELARKSVEDRDWDRARIQFRSLAEGAYGDPPSLTIERLQANAALQVGLIDARQYRQETASDARAKYRADAENWLQRAAQQTADARIADQAKKVLAELN